MNSDRAGGATSKLTAAAFALVGAFSCVIVTASAPTATKATITAPTRMPHDSRFFCSIDAKGASR